MSFLGQDPLFRKMWANKLLGKFQATVENNKDPKKLYRLKLRIDSVFGWSDQPIVTDWAEPCMPIGYFFVPEIGDEVWVEFKMGHIDFPIWMNKFVSPEAAEELPDDTNYPDNHIIETPQGNYTMEFNEKEGNEYFKLTTKSDQIIHCNDKEGEESILIKDKNLNQILMDQEGAILKDFNDNSFTLNEDGVVIEDANGNVITMNGDGVSLVDSNGNEINLGSDGIVIKDSNGNEINLGSSNIKFNSSANSIVLDGSKYELHMHTGNLGAPTTPPMDAGTE